MTKLFRTASPSCLLAMMSSVPNAKTSLMTSKLTSNSLTWITLRSSCCFHIQNTANGSQILKNVSWTIVDIDLLCRIFGNRGKVPWLSWFSTYSYSFEYSPHGLYILCESLFASQITKLNLSFFNGYGEISTVVWPKPTMILVSSSFLTWSMASSRSSQKTLETLF